MNWIDVVNGIDELIKTRVNQASYVGLMIATITEVSDSTSGAYKITYDGKTSIDAQAVGAPDTRYEKDDGVQVLKLNGDTNSNIPPFIIGKSGSVTKKDLSSIANYYIIQDTVTAVNLGSEYTKQNNSIVNAIAAKGTLVLSAVFSAPAGEEKQYNNYGIKITLKFIKGEKEYSHIYNFDTTQMVGQPWKYNGVKQIYTVELDEADRVYLQSITLSGINLNSEGGGSAENIELASAITSYSHEYTINFVDTTNKVYFVDQNYPSVDLKVQARQDGVSFDSSLCDYYWFKRDAAIIGVDSNGYHEYGGTGWKLLNKVATYTYVTEGGVEQTETIVKNDIGTKLTLTSGSLQSYHNYYKCVLVYGRQRAETTVRDVLNLAQSALTFSLTATPDKITTDIADINGGIITGKVNLTLGAEEELVKKISWSYKKDGGARTPIEGEDIVKQIVYSNEDSALNTYSVYFGEQETIFYCDLYADVNQQALLGEISITIPVDLGRQKILETWYFSQETKDPAKIITTKPQLQDNGLNKPTVKYEGEAAIIGVQDIAELPLEHSPYIWKTTRWVQKTVTNAYVYRGEYTPLQCYSINGETFSLAAEQYDAFLSLTNNTEDQGLFYGPRYRVSQDQYKEPPVPDPQKTYYIYARAGGEDQYTEITNLTEFKSNIIYYEKDNDGLYVNSELVHANTLQVANTRGEKFYASVYDDEVRIGGFRVDENSLVREQGYVYSLTNDLTRDISKTYYIKENQPEGYRETNSEDFDENGEFKSDIEYYERIQNKIEISANGIHLGERLSLLSDGSMQATVGSIGGLILEKKTLHSQYNELGLYGGGYQDLDKQFMVDSVFWPETKTSVNFYAGQLEQIYKGTASSAAEQAFLKNLSITSSGDYLKLEGRYKASVSGTQEQPQYVDLTHFTINFFSCTMEYSFKLENLDQVYSFQLSTLWGSTNTTLVMQNPTIYTFSVPKACPGDKENGREVNVVSSKILFDILEDDSGNIYRKDCTANIVTPTYYASHEGLGDYSGYRSGRIEFSVSSMADYRNMGVTEKYQIRIKEIQGTFSMPMKMYGWAAPVCTPIDKNYNTEFNIEIRTGNEFNTSWLESATSSLTRAVIDTTEIAMNMTDVDPYPICLTSTLIQYKYYPYIQSTSPITKHSLYVTNEGYVYAQYLKVINDLAATDIKATDIDTHNIEATQIDTSQVLVGSTATTMQLSQKGISLDTPAASINFKKSISDSVAATAMLSEKTFYHPTADTKYTVIALQGNVGLYLNPYQGTTTVPTNGSSIASIYPVGKNFDGKPGSVGYLAGHWYIESEDTASPITSDKNSKYSIIKQPLIYSTLYDKLQPVIFKYSRGTSNRYHTGLIAQDVETALQEVGLASEDFGAICFDKDENGNKINYGIRYTELVSMNIYEIQKLKARTKLLEQTVNELQLVITDLKTQLKEIKGDNEKNDN